MLLTSIAAHVNNDLHKPFLKQADAKRLMIKLIVAYKFASCYPISSMMIQHQLAALSNRCATEVAFAGPSVIAMPDIPTDFSMLIPVHNYQCHWQFQAPTRELINRPVYILPMLLAQYEDPETVLAHLINPVLKTSASTIIRRSMLTMSQSAQTDITDSSIRRCRMNAGNRAERLARAGATEPASHHPIALEGPSTSTAQKNLLFPLLTIRTIASASPIQC